jgi:hypothetical protein
MATLEEKIKALLESQQSDDLEEGTEGAAVALKQAAHGLEQAAAAFKDSDGDGQSDDEDEEKKPQVIDGGHMKQSNDNTFNGPNVTPQVIEGGADMSEIVPPVEEKKQGGFLQRAMSRMSAPKNSKTS